VRNLADVVVDFTSGGQKRPLTLEQTELIQKNREAALKARKKESVQGIPCTCHPWVLFVRESHSSVEFFDADGRMMVFRCLMLVLLVSSSSFVQWLELALIGAGARGGVGFS
jgi:hypothetical protein